MLFQTITSSLLTTHLFNRRSRHNILTLSYYLILSDVLIIFDVLITSDVLFIFDTHVLFFIFRTFISTH